MFGRMLLAALLMVVPVALVVVIFQHNAPARGSNSTVVEQALSADSDVSQQGVQALRDQGPAGLAEILEIRDAMAA